jgi:hypothetical protein
MASKEIITSTIDGASTFYARQEGFYGPSIVTLRTYSHVSSTGRDVARTFRVMVNGEERWGGFANHLPENGPEGLGKFIQL